MGTFYVDVDVGLHWPLSGDEVSHLLDALVPHGVALRFGQYQHLCVSMAVECATQQEAHPIAREALVDAIQVAVIRMGLLRVQTEQERQESRRA